ncbi:hypothetical protein MBGDN05_00282 [Thermoplasmatales archaeon SCGC AB-539-N05]|nr:hypothetical protein MBGDN05_00282 [Thermoplasmatales archaeon SCGC AB-539-N05]
MKILTFLSDFGHFSSYVAQMKGIASSMTDARLVDISHDITKYNVEEGAFVLMTAVPYFPDETVHVAVVDPGVGTERKGIVVKAIGHLLVGPDNGLLIPAARFLGSFKVFEITNGKYMLPNVSCTFHGRDVFTPVAAHLANGVLPEEIGEEIDDYVNLDFGKSKQIDGKIIGKIIYIDRFGNVITNIRGDEFLEHVNYNKKIRVSIKDKNYEIQFIESYGFVNKNEMLLTVGSHGFVEVSTNQGDVSKALRIERGNEVIVYLD